MWTLELLDEPSSSRRAIAQLAPRQDVVASGSIREAATYWFRISGDLPDVFNVELEVNGRRLRSEPRSTTCILFEWPIDFNAGIADVVVRGVPGGKVSWRFVVDPATEKLTRQQYLAMLRDIFEDSASLASTSGLTQGVSSGTRTLPIAVVEYALAQVPRLASLLHQLNDNRRLQLRRETRQVDLGRARRVDGRALSRTRRWRPEGTIDNDNLRELAAKSGGLLPRDVGQTSARARSDRREHADILGLVFAFSRLLSRAMVSLEAAPEAQRDDVLLGRCRRALPRVTALRALPVFDGVTPTEGQWKHSHLYSRVEPYRSLFRIHRDILKGVNGVDGDFTQVGLRETWRLYESWVALRLLRAADRRTAGGVAAELQLDRSSKDGLTLNLAGQDISLGHGLRLRIQPTYREAWRESGQIASYTRPMTPDLTIEYCWPNDELKLIVIDTKYRIGGQLSDAVTSLHTYRDALVNTHEAITGNWSHGVGPNRTTTGAFIISPAKPSEASAVENAWKDVAPPDVYFRRDYQERFDLGVIRLVPGADLSTCEAVFDALLEALH